MLYNVTVSIDPAIETDWVHWMQNVHIPAVLKTNCFTKCVLSKVHGNEAGEQPYKWNILRVTKVNS